MEATMTSCHRCKEILRKNKLANLTVMQHSLTRMRTYRSHLGTIPRNPQRLRCSDSSGCQPVRWILSALQSLSAISTNTGCRRLTTSGATRTMQRSSGEWTISAPAARGAPPRSHRSNSRQDRITLRWGRRRISDRLSVQRPCIVYFLKAGFRLIAGSPSTDVVREQPNVRTRMVRKRQGRHENGRRHAGICSFSANSRVTRAADT